MTSPKPNVKVEHLKPVVGAKLKSVGTFWRNYFFGFVSALALCFGAIASFVLFCPVWQEWRHPEQPEPQVHVKTTVTPPKVYLMPVRTRVVNRGNEKPSLPAPKPSK